MKKDLIFAPILLVIGALLFLYDFIGAPAHIALTMAGVLILAVYTAKTKKIWKLPALEIAMRACYGIAMLTGVVIMNVDGIAVLEIAHKASAGLFMALMIVLLTHKVATNKKEND